MMNLCKHRARHSRSCCGGGDVTRSVEALRGLEHLNLECIFEAMCVNTSDQLQVGQLTGVLRFGGSDWSRQVHQVWAYPQTQNWTLGPVQPQC